MARQKPPEILTIDLIFLLVPFATKILNNKVDFAQQLWFIFKSAKEETCRQIGTFTQGQVLSSLNIEEKVTLLMIAKQILITAITNSQHSVFPGETKYINHCFAFFSKRVISSN